MGNSSKHTVPEQEVIKDGVCYMCGSNCPTKVHVRKGKAVHIDMLDQRIAEICPRWKAQLDFIYHPDRLKYPLKRVSDRGTGAFDKFLIIELLIDNYIH
ncbi:Dimethyl sulfoxide reductase DmsA [subsurface metagenome]